MVKLWELLEKLRSKNASPCWQTFDIIFKDHEIYERVKKSGMLTEELITKLYGRSPTDFVWFDPGRALKVTLKRRRPNGNVGDPDVFGCGQHIPLYNVEIRLE